MTPVAEDVTTAAKTDTGTAPLTFAHTVPRGWKNYLVVVVCSLNGDALAISSVTWNGWAMTLVNNQNLGSANQRMRVYGLAAPDVGSFNVVITQTVATRRIAAVARSLSEVDLNSVARLGTTLAGVEDGPGHNILSSTTLGNATASAPNATAEYPDLILTFVKHIGTGPIAPDSPQTQDYNTEFVSGEFFAGGQLPATTDPTSWSWTADVAGNWGLADVVFIANTIPAPILPRDPSRRNVVPTSWLRQHGQPALGRFG